MYWLQMLQWHCGSFKILRRKTGFVSFGQRCNLCFTR